MRKILSEAYESASSGFGMPAPIGGWNARDSVARMRDTDAIYLDNWFPSTTTVEVRPGMEEDASLPSGKLTKSLLNCALETGSSKRFAVAQDGVYNFTAGGSIVSAAHALTDARVEHINLTVGGKAWMWCCNGVDKAFAYKSETDTFIPLDGASTPALTGITSTDVVNVSLFKYRVILCKKNSLSFFYLPLNSVGGAASEFDLGAVFKRGGYLMATSNWTVDAGDGADDRFLAITSEGELAVYTGTDPSNLSTFALVGVYFVGKPVGKRCFAQLGNDVVILTEQGVWPLSRATETGKTGSRALTDKIQNAFNDYYKLYSDQFGWQPITYPRGPALLVNIPITATLSYQFVMNTLTGAWCRFIGWSATCMMVSGGELYYAIGNKIYHAWTGSSDGTSAIDAKAKQAFTRGPSKTRIKQVKLVRPVFESDSTGLKYVLGLDTDYQNAETTASEMSTVDSLTKWDTAVYDTSVWGGAEGTFLKWETVAHEPGKAWSLRLRTLTKNVSLSWSAVDYICEVGGLFG